MIGVDIFAGAGGMSLGALAAGVDVQSVVESDIYASNTYLANHQPKYGVFADDIRNYEPCEFEYDRERSTMVVFGGPPCQGFSTSNQRTRNAKNPNNWLFEEFVRVVSDIRPEWFVFENVKGIAETEKGVFVDEILDRFTSLGYTVEWSILSSEGFGVPQKRARFFIVGSSEGKSFKFPKPNSQVRITVGDAIGDLPQLNNGANQSYLKYPVDSHSEYSKQMRANLDGCSNHFVTRNNKLVLNRYKHVPQGGNWENIPASLMKNYADRSRCHTGIYRRLAIDEPSVVIGNFRKNMLIHPTQNRGLSVREAARLQSFPDGFVFKGSIGFQQQQVGNAVPPLLAKAIFEELISQSS